MKVLGGPASQLLGSRVAREIGCALAIVEFKQFPDGELYLRIAEELDGDTLIVQSTTTNDDIVYFLQLIDAASDGYLRAEFLILAMRGKISDSSSANRSALVPSRGGSTLTKFMLSTSTTPPHLTIFSSEVAKRRRTCLLQASLARI